MDSLQLLTLYLALAPIFSGRKAKIKLHMTPKLTVVIPISCLLPCADPGISSGVGVHVNMTKKALTALFVCFLLFLVLGLFYSGHMVNYKEKYHFSRFRRGPNFSRGGGGDTEYNKCLFPILLIPYRNPNNL